MIMYDAVSNLYLPSGAGAYAGYVNGDYADCPAIRKKFPHTRVFGIDVKGTDWENASIFDYEPGCIYSPLTLRYAVYKREQFRPRTSVVYCDRDDLPAITAACTGLWYLVWIATLDGTVMTGERTNGGHLIVGTQIATVNRAGMEFDVSDIEPSWVK
jgi:hypothetical protein